jgi:hypothetical protein
VTGTEIRDQNGQCDIVGALTVSHGMSNRFEHFEIFSRTCWVSACSTKLTCRLDKMLVDNIGDVTITNDGATILSLLEVTHPAVCCRQRFH